MTFQRRSLLALAAGARGPSADDLESLAAAFLAELGTQASA